MCPVFDCYPDSDDVFTHLGCGRVDKTNESLVRFITLSPNEHKWVTFWTTPMLLDKIKGLKGTVTLAAASSRMVDPDTTNNSYLNKTCFPYVE